MNQIENKMRDRGGIPVRDYRQDGRPSNLKMMNFDRVGHALVWVSLGLGLMEVLMPRRIQKSVGVRGSYSGLIRLLGLREITHAFLIFMQARPLLGVWSRVADDAMDLASLGTALTARSAQKGRVAVAAASVLGLTALDVYTGLQINRELAEEKRYSTMTKVDLDSRTRGGAFHVTRSITINSTPEVLYQFWRQFENLPQFMYHLQSVRVIDERRSHWVAKAPAGQQVAWDAEITDDQPNERIAWRSIQGSEVPNSGIVRFKPAPARRGAEVQVDMEYRPPAGAVGKVIARLFGEEPGQQVAGDLRRFKQVIETGEVLLSEGSPQGYGQMLQRPARPLEEGKAPQASPSTPKQGEQLPEWSSIR